MRQLRAMMKKELFEQLKTHRLVVMLLLFTLVGVLSPAFAKMTPWLLDLVSGDMAETGIQIGNLATLVGKDLRIDVRKPAFIE